MNIFKKFWYVIEKKYQKSLVFLIFCMLLGAAFETLGITLIIPLISIVLSEDFLIPEFLSSIFPFLELASQQEVVIYAVCFFIIFYIFKSLYLGCLVYIQTRFAYSMQTNISTRLYRTYLDQPYSFHLNKNSGHIISNTITESQQFAMSFTSPLLYFLTDIFIILGILILLLLIEPIGALTILLVFLLGSISFYFFSADKASKWGEMRQAQEAKRIQTAQQGINGIKDVKLYGFESAFAKYFTTSTHISLTSGRLQTTMQGMPKIFFEFLTVIVLSGLILLLSFSDKASAEIVSVLGVFAMSAFKLLPSIARLITNIQAFRFAMPVVDIIEKELMLELIDPHKQIFSKLKYEDNIVLNNISFLYESSERSALKNINLNIKAGQTIGFIGSSGAGKSTLIDIILGLLTPSKGQILVDSQLINEANLKAWQKKIGYVSQSIYLLDDTFRRNIAFGLPDEDIDEEKIKNAIKLAQLDEFITSLPDKLETFVGEAGVRISGGQRQRIGIARALYNDPDILVLDEATSALDIDTELDVMKSIRSLHGQKTILIIAHRLSTVKNCDYVYKLDNGSIIQSGLPDEVL